MQYALALSLALHIGAALLIIVAGGFSTGEKTPQHFIIQDIALTPSISAPAPAMVAPPSETVPAQTIPTPAPIQETGQPPAQESATTQAPQPSDSSKKVGVLMSTPLGLGMTHGYFSGLADGKTLRDNIRSYYFDMVEKINREWWDKAGLLKEPLRQDGIFELLLQRDGTIISVRMLQSSGSNEADRLLMDIIRKASPLPPLPSTYELDMFRVPIRIKAPSFLFRFKN